MQDQSTPMPLTPRNGVLTLTGYGIRATVERGYLIASDGVGRQRRSGRFSRVHREIRRLVVIGHTGTISFEALRWLADTGACFTQIDSDGNVVVASGPARLDDARLRRAQVLAGVNGVGITIARDLLRTKIGGQAAVIARLPNAHDTAPVLMSLMGVLSGAHTPEKLRVIEAEAAKAYWGAWESIPLLFARRDAPKVPAHWQTFGQRTSLLSGSPRSATNPANAILNYLYAILEAEARIAAIAVGLDPGIGILHADQRGRDSLACDLMEAARPLVGGFVLDTLQKRAFAARDFFEDRQETCRLMPALAQILAETAPRWAKEIAPVAEMVAKTLFAGENANRTDRAKKIATPLTQANRSAGRDGVRRGTKREPSGRGIELPKVCAGCGGILADQARRYCDACLPEHEAEKLSSLMTSGTDALARMRAEGRDPTKTNEALQQQSVRMSERRRAAREWDEEHGTEYAPDMFTRDILPRIQGVPLSALMQATGLSKRQCSRIRQGLSTPHPQHWAALSHSMDGTSERGGKS